MENVTFDYKFYRIPKRFFKEDTFRDMTNVAKVLYGILLDCKCLSDSNGDAWRDEYGITYIIFTIEEIMNLMNLGNKKVNKMLKELEEHGLQKISAVFYLHDEYEKSFCMTKSNNSGIPLQFPTPFDKANSLY